MSKRIIKKIKYRIFNRIFCYFCLYYKYPKRYKLARKYGRFPIDADYSSEDECVYPVYANVGICQSHLRDYENGEGIFDPHAY